MRINLFLPSFLLSCIITFTISCQKESIEALDPTPDNLLKIGDIHEGGIIFYIDATGEHGKLCSSENLEKTTNLGRLNWDDAMSKSEAYSEGGFTDWYLPSIEELEQMNNNLYLNDIGNFTETFYWSSTEDQDDQNRAWVQKFAISEKESWFGTIYYGETAVLGKDNNRRFRAVRTF